MQASQDFTLTVLQGDHIWENGALYPYGIMDYIMDIAENLIECGGMDELRGSRPQKLWSLHMLYNKLRRRGRATVAAGLFELGDEAGPAAPDIPGYSLSEKLSYEQKVLHFCVTAHPMAAYAERYESGEWTPISRVSSQIGRRVTVAGFPITSKDTTTGKGERMRFISLEDHTGVLEVVFFPDVFRRCARMLGDAPLVVRGRATEDEGAITFEAEGVSH